MRHIVGNGALLRLWAAQIISELGNFIFFTALVVELYDRTESGRVLGFESALRNAALIIAGLLAGPLVDRWRRRTTLYVSDLVRGALLLLPLIYPTVPVFIATSTLVVIASSFFGPARMAWVPSLVSDRGHLQVVNSVFSVTTETIGVIGALAGGVVAATLGFRAAVLTDMAAYLVSAALIASIPPSGDPVPERPESSRYWLDLIEGFRYTKASPVLRTLILSFLLGSFAAGLITPMTMVYVERGLGLGATSYGVFLAAMAMGAMISAASLSRLGLTVVQVLVWIGYLCTGATLVLIGLVPGVAVSLLLFVLLGFCQNLMDATAITFFQQQVPGHMLARFFGILNAMTTPFYIGGMLTGGMVSETYDVGLIYLASGVLFILGFALLQLSPHIRSLREGEGPSAEAAPERKLG